MTAFSFDALRRFPDLEAPNLHAVDASDRLILELAAADIAAAGEGEVVVIGDRYGALTLGAIALHGATGVRVHQDPLSGEEALARNAGAVGLSGHYRSGALDAALLAGARVVLLQIPRAVDELDEIAQIIAEAAAADVVVYAGGRIKHMSVGMNEVLRRHFARLDVSLAAQKSRVLMAREPVRVAGAPDSNSSAWPRCRRHDDLDLTVCAHGAVFSGAGVDVGTRYLLGFIPDMPQAECAIDLGCGSGILAAAVAKAQPTARVIATDQSAAAVASTLATAVANGLGDRIEVVRDDALSSQPDDSADLIVLNPPFHVGSTVHTGIAHALFADARRVLRPGGQLWTVWNTHLGYRAALTRLVGPTRQAGRNAKFTVTVSTR